MQMSHRYDFLFSLSDLSEEWSDFTQSSAAEEKEERINVKPRRLPKKRDEDEPLEEDEAEPNKETPKAPRNKPKATPQGERVSARLLLPIRFSIVALVEIGQSSR